MARQKNRPTKKTLATGLIVSGMILTSLATTGCGTQAAEQAAALAPGSTAVSIDAIAVKPNLTSKLAANHNETFRVATEL